MCLLKNYSKINPYLVLKDYLSEKKSGDDGTVDTPVPIPNTEVKHRNGDCIRKERGARCRAFFLLFFSMFLMIKPFIYLVIW